MREALSNFSAQKMRADTLYDDVVILRDDIEAVKNTLLSADGQIKRYIDEIAVLRTSQSKDREAVEEKLQLITKMRDEIPVLLKGMSKDALDANSKAFFTQAEVRFKALQDAAEKELLVRQDSITQSLNPIKDTLQKFEVLSREIDEKRTRSDVEITTQIRDLTETQRFLHSETSLLVKALREPTTRGHYGQKVLKQVLEVSGMVENIHFNEQVSFVRDGNTLIADVVVNLSDGQRIVIDAKAPIQAQLDFVRAIDDKERNEKLKQLSQNILNYAKDLQSKEYWKAFLPSAGIMIMFVAPESALAAAMQYDDNLWDECIKRRILLATPTSLVAMLLTVGFGWRQVEFTLNAENIRKIGQELYESLSILGDNFLKLGQSISSTHDKYLKALGSLDGNVFPKARRMKELGVPTSNRTIPDIAPPSLETKALRSRELLTMNAGFEQEIEPVLLPNAESDGSVAAASEEGLLLL